MDDTDRKGLLTKLAFQIVEYLDDAGYHRTCLTCAHWVEDDGVNKQMCAKYGRRPPTKIIVSGCPDHTDLIPF
jgi:hypothetical protein